MGWRENLGGHFRGGWVSSWLDGDLSCFFLLQYFPVLLQFEYTLDFITHDLTQAGSQGVAECLLYPVK